MHRFILPLLLLTSCATAHRTTYHQSAFPGAAEFSAAEDAPHTMGQPGYAGEPEKVPRGTDRRLLPQTERTRREPGIWAGDGPKAINGRMPDLLDVVFPLPDGVSQEDVPALAQCANAYGPIFWRLPDSLKHALRLEKEDRSCLVYALLGDCLYRAEAAKPGSVPKSVQRMIDNLFRQCYPRFGSYSPIITDVEAMRGRIAGAKKGDH